MRLQRVPALYLANAYQTDSGYRVTDECTCPLAYSKIKQNFITMVTNNNKIYNSVFKYIRTWDLTNGIVIKVNLLKISGLK